MLDRMRMWAGAALALWLSVSASTAQESPAPGQAPAPAGKEYVILFIGKGFFPHIAYVNTGDRVRFLNATDTQIRIVGEDASWELGPMATNEDTVLDIEEDTALTFQAQILRSDLADFTPKGELVRGAPPSF